MSTRLYPLYKRGNPQLRIFLPNFWMKIVQPPIEQPTNVVQFACSMEMTRYDIKNYLEKIYNVKVVHVRTRIEIGKLEREPVKGYIKKLNDTKYGYVTLPKGTNFEFPNIFENDKYEEEKQEHEKAMEQSKKNFEKYIDKNKNRVGTPGWFSI